MFAVCSDVWCFDVGERGAVEGVGFGTEVCCDGFGCGLKGGVGRVFWGGEVN